MTMKALIIEDSPKTRENLKNVLSCQEELEVAAVASGEEAFTNLQDGFLPDFIVLDINLPGMDGADILSKLHKNKQWKKIPVFPYSALWREEKLKPYEEDLDIVRKWMKAVKVQFDENVETFNPVIGKPDGKEDSDILNPRLIIALATFLNRNRIELSPSLKNLAFTSFNLLEELRKK